MTETTIKQTSTVSDSLVLQYLVREPQVKSSKNKGLILLHGLGNNEQDLFSLPCQLPKDFYIISPVDR